MLVAKDGKTYKMTKKNFRKILLRHATEHAYNLEEYGKELGTVDADLTTLTPDEAMDKVEQFV